MKFRICVLILFFSVLPLKSQVILNSNIRIDSLIVKKYGWNEYVLLLADTAKYNVINYYQTQSFILERYLCASCPKFNSKYFDVMAYESLRQDSTRYFRAYSKYGFKLTLLAKNELLRLMPFQEP